MAGKVVLILSVVQIFLCLVESQVTQRDKEPVWKYACKSAQIVCQYGFAVHIIEIKYGRINGGCTEANVATATKGCELSPSIGLSFLQNVSCSDKTWCVMYDYSGYNNCPDGQGLSNYGAVHYICKFVGFDGGRESPPTTTPTTTATIPTTTTPTTPTKSTAASTTTQTESRTTSLSPTAPMTSSSTADTQTSVTTHTETSDPGDKVTTDSNTVSTSQTTRAKSGAASQTGDGVNTNLIIGVSIGAIVLILIIIVLVECKRQSHKRQNYKEEQTPDLIADNHTIQPVTAEERALATEGKVKYLDETKQGSGERERKFRKKSETNPAFEGQSTDGNIEPVQSEESQSKGNFRGRRDSGVSSTFLAEETGGGSPAEGNEPPEQVENIPVPPADTPVDRPPEPQPTRHVSFSDLATSTEHVYDNPSGGQTIIRSQYEGNPHLDPNVTGPISEEEVLY